MQEIQYHGSSNRAVSDTPVCFPSAGVCPEKFDCGDPGTPSNGKTNFSGTLEDSIVTYACNPGYTLVGNEMRTCEVTPDGVLWTGSVPECQSMRVGFTSANFTGSEESGSLSIEIISTQELPPNSMVILSVVFTAVSATGSGVDFVSDSLTATLNSGENRIMINVPVVCDKQVEDTETFDIVLSVQSNESIPVQLGLSRATGIITDSTVEVMFNQSTYTANAVDSTTPTLVLNQPSPVQFEVTVSVIDLTNLGRQTFKVPISEGTTTRSFAVNLITSDIVKCTNTYNLTVSTSESWCGAATNTNNVSQVIAANHNVGAISISFVGQSPSVLMESAGSLAINFSLNATASEDITAEVNTTDSSATAGSDYGQAGVSSPFVSFATIPRGELFVIHNVDIIDDMVQEDNETFSLAVNLQSTCLPVSIVDDQLYNITIIDNEGVLAVQFSDAVFNGSESSGAVIVTLILIGGTASEDIYVTVSPSSASATGGVDYDNAPLVAMFNAGDSTAIVTIPVMSDTVIEEDEMFYVNIDMVDVTEAEVELGTLTNATAIILDSTLPQITIHPVDETVKLQNDTTSVILTCLASGASSYLWERLNDGIQSNAEGANSNELVLVNLKPSDDGQYRCIAINEHGTNYSDYATLTIIAKPPKVIVTPSLLNVDEGQSATLRCSATGVGADSFTYQWWLNNVLINRETEPALIIAATSQTDTGDYSCIVGNKYGGFGVSDVVTLILNEQFCNAVTVSYTGFAITWNMTSVGVTAEAPCSGAGIEGVVRRRCIGGDEWEEFNECIRVEVEMLADEAANFSSSLINLTDTEIVAKVDDIITKLATLTEPQMRTQFVPEITLAVEILDMLNNATEMVVDMQHPNDTFFEKTADVVDNLLSDAKGSSWEQLRKTSPETSQSLVTCTETFVRLLGRTLNNETMQAYKARQNIVIKAELTTEEDIKSDKPYMFPNSDDNIESFTGRSAQVMLSTELLKSVLSQLPPNTTEFAITNFVIRNNSISLPSPSNGTAERRPVSSIISSQLPIPVNQMPENSIMLILDVPTSAEINDDLQETTASKSARQHRTCEFYNHSLSLNINQVGGWSGEGVRVDEDNSNETTITCHSNHLTSFAVLVSLQDSKSSSSEDKALSIVSYIGCAISLVFLGLSIIILSLVLYTKKQTNNVVFIHLNLCISLALALLVFVAGIETAKDSKVSCILVAVLIQYFFTSAFCWMLCEGILLYMLLITVFGNKLNTRAFFFILGWGVAIPIVAISVGVAHEHYGTDDYCWIESGSGAIAGFLIPIAIMILINCIFLAMALRVLCTTQVKSRSDKRISNKKAIKDFLKAILIFLPLLGVTWIFGILAVNEDLTVFAWIFAILNTLQGVFIFVFHVARNDQVQLMKRIKQCYRSDSFYSFYNRLFYQSIIYGKGSNARRKFKDPDHVSHISNGNNTSSEIQVSTSFINSSSIDKATVTTFKPNGSSDHPIDNKPAPVILMAVNPLNETTIHEVKLVPHEGYDDVNGGDTEKITSITNGHA